MKHLLFLTIFSIVLYGCRFQQTGNNIISGIPWFDNKGNAVNAHGACIVEENGRYYLFGEYKSDTANVFTGFSCYSSTDLVNWQFERIVLPQQKDGLLGPNRVGERVKVMRCPATGEYVMYMHCDDIDYKDPHIGYATCKIINGGYEFQGALLYEEQPIKRWDMGTFQDDDGKGYLLIHHGDIYRLNDDYKSAKKLLPYIHGMGESPAMFKKDGVYFLLSSKLTGWERNDNMYHTSANIEGPWTKQGLFAPEGTLTYNSQCTFVFPQICNKNTRPMYMGDRWSFTKQGSCATYVWLPLHVEGTKLTLQKPENIAPEGKKLLEKPFVSNTEGDFAEVKFSGKQIAVYGESNVHGGYGRITITDKNGRTVISSPIDFYSKVPDRAVRYISPRLPKGDYTLKVEVIGENSTWSDKKMDIFYGSDDCFVNVENIIQMQASVHSEATVELHNPIIPGFFADPSFIEYEGKFYVYATADPWGKDCLTCWISDDFQNWYFHTLNYPTKETCTSPTSNEHMVWAPSVVKRGNIFYMFVSVGSEVWCGVSKHPLGPWKNPLGNQPLIPFDTTHYYHVIDAEAYIDDDGKAYLYWGSGWDWINGHCFAAELNDDMCSFRTKPVEITPNNYFEAPFMIKHNGKYFLTYSDGKTIDSTYKVRYAVGDSPLDTFEEATNSPILETNDSLQVYGPGHHTFFSFHGKNYILYHRHSLPFVEGTANRQICINEFEFDDVNCLIKNIIPFNTQQFPNIAK